MKEQTKVLLIHQKHLQYTQTNNNKTKFYLGLLHLSLIHWKPAVALDFTFLTPVEATDLVFPKVSPTLLEILELLFPVFLSKLV